MSNIEQIAHDLYQKEGYLIQAGCTILAVDRLVQKCFPDPQNEDEPETLIKQYLKDGEHRLILAEAITEFYDAELVKRVLTQHIRETNNSFKEENTKQDGGLFEELRTFVDELNELNKRTTKMLEQKNSKAYDEPIEEKSFLLKMIPEEQKTIVDLVNDNMSDDWRKKFNYNVKVTCTVDFGDGQEHKMQFSADNEKMQDLEVLFQSYTDDLAVKQVIVPKILDGIQSNLRDLVL